jgi:Bacteriophage head to tail connecting protein
MKQRVRDLIEQGDKKFSERHSLLVRWQDIAENFYPERADFTGPLTLGEDFAANLMSSYPLLVRRDLANTFSSMLRPRATPWFHCRTDDENINETAGPRRWLDFASDVLRRMMYDPRAQFVRATKEGDNDYAAFGQCVIKVEPNRTFDGLLYRTRHLRDVVWCENAELKIDVIHDNWPLEVRELCRLFPKTVAAQVEQVKDKEPYRLVKCRRIILPSDQYDSHYEGDGRFKRRMPFRSIYVDAENDVILEEIGVPSIDYVIPRWVTMPGSQYAFSPAVNIALPDARMLQQIGLTLLEAGQKAVDPPMVAVGEIITGGVNTYAGGVTWVDAEYDERTGEAVRPMNIDTRGLNWGVAREQQAQAMIREAFYLNAIQLPEIRGDMTAYEVQKRVEEYIRQALPLFEPMEVEYNGGLCEKSFEIALRMRAFGSLLDMPEELRGQDVRFQFESPLQSATERAKANAFLQAGQLLAAAMQLDPSVRHDIDIDTAFREAVLGSGIPSDWLVDEDQAQQAKDAERQAAAQQADAAQQLQAVGAVADVAARAGEAGQALQGAGMV